MPYRPGVGPRRAKSIGETDPLLSLGTRFMWSVGLNYPPYDGRNLGMQWAQSFLKIL